MTEKRRIIECSAFYEQHEGQPPRLPDLKTFDDETEMRKWLDAREAEGAVVRVSRMVVVRCCGEPLYCEGFTTTCPQCGADYNHNGNRLAPRSQWGEETGEHFS